MSDMFKLFQTLRLAPFGLYLWYSDSLFFFFFNIIVIVKNVAFTITTDILCDNDRCNPFVSTQPVDVSEALCCWSNMNLIFVALCDIS